MLQDRFTIKNAHESCSYYESYDFLNLDRYWTFYAEDMSILKRKQKFDKLDYRLRKTEVD